MGSYFPIEMNLLRNSQSFVFDFYQILSYAYIWVQMHVMLLKFYSNLNLQFNSDLIIILIGVSKLLVYFG